MPSIAAGPVIFAADAESSTISDLPPFAASSIARRRMRR
jgi:hypothetical protein